MAERSKRKMKNFFIKEDMQGRLILTVFLTVVGGGLTLFLLVGIFSADTITIAYSDKEIQVGPTLWILFKNGIAANWVFLLVCATFLVAATLAASHRIAGPLSRIEEKLAGMATGNLSGSISLRRTDEGKELVEKINQFNETIREKLTAINHHSAAISEALARYDRDKTTPTPENTTAILEEIRQHNEHLRKQTDYFTLDND